MLHLSLSHNPPLSLDAATIDRINTNWDIFFAQKRAFENDTLVRYLSHTETKISIATDITYKDVVGLRLSGAPAQVPFLALSAIAFVRTSDGHYLLQTRNSGDWPESLELPGGFIRASMTKETTETFIRRRVVRDLEISNETIKTVTHLDLFPFPEILEQMLVFVITLNQSAAEVTASRAHLCIVPENYQSDTHDTYFKLPFHYPSQVIWESYRDRINI